MKAIIYTNEGKVCREVKCDNIEPYGKALFLLKGANIYTNQPVVACGRQQNWDHMLPGYQSFDVTFTVGETVRKWEGARVLVYFGSAISFWHDNEWHTVVGNVIIENMREASSP